MKRRFSFLSSLAIAVSALAAGSAVHDAQAKPAPVPTDDSFIRAPAPVDVPGASAFVLTRNAEGMIETAQHSSHWSHSSHASHASHSSHYSSRY